MARSCAIRHAAAGGSRFVFKASCTLSVRPELACSVAKEPLRAEQDSKQRRSAPVCMLRAGGALIPLSSPPSRRGGWRADKAQCPDCSRRMSGSGRTMMHNCGVHPRLAARQRAFSAYASSTFGPARSYLSLGGFSERRPWVGLRDCPTRRCPPAPRLANASGRRPSNTDRDGVDIAELHAKHNNFLSLSVNDVCVMLGDVPYVRV
jgi:hypothetical protein